MKVNFYFSSLNNLNIFLTFIVFINILIIVNGFNDNVVDENIKWNNNRQDEVRCYCNLPICITTGYMCKTTNKKGSGCFTDVTVSVPVQRAAHGCLDLLDSIKRTQCRNEPSVVNSDEQFVKSTDVVNDITTESSSLLLCCNEDMCNHVDMPDNHIKYNDSVMAAAVLAGTGLGIIKQQQQQLTSSPHDGSVIVYNSEVWFRAATIAVPVCGALILLILIMLAIKMLKSDTDDTIINSKFRSKRGGVLPLYSPIHVNTTGTLPISQTDVYESKINDMKLTSPNKMPLLFHHYQQQNDNKSRQKTTTNCNKIIKNPKILLTNPHNLKYDTNTKYNYSYCNNNIFKENNDDYNFNNKSSLLSNCNNNLGINKNKFFSSSTNNNNSWNLLNDVGDVQTQREIYQSSQQCTDDIHERLVTTLVNMSTNNNNKLFNCDKTLMNNKPNNMNNCNNNNNNNNCDNSQNNA
ncbi:uncharacterized protein LOC142333594 [Lycorma delicatula]|uniref:uncharacterized protein LOC142333594 n=1 Tax=Lycorma delicatula TaxID=130591 RepID=UPI003F518112